MNTTSFPFTVARIEKAACPAGKDRIALFDTRTPGLAMIVTARGSKSYYWIRSGLGKTLKTRLGGVGEISLDEARALAAEHNAARARGVDPTRAHGGGDALTFGDVFGLWMNEHAKPHKKSWRADQETFDYYLTPWAKKRLTDIDPSRVRTLHAKIGRDRPVRANRVIALVATVFNWARKAGYCPANPADGVKRFRERSRTRFLSADELKRLFLALRESDNPLARDFVLLSLFTGARKSNVLAMRWTDIDLHAGAWTIPHGESKSGEAVMVYLSPPALAVLQRRRDEGGEGPYVLPSPRTDTHLIEPKRFWKDLCHRAALSDLNLHDLRRTLGSWLAAGGASMPIIGASLGHEAGSDATRVYARLSADPVRSAVNDAAAAMMNAGGKLLFEGDDDDTEEIECGEASGGYGKDPI